MAVLPSGRPGSAESRGAQGAEESVPVAADALDIGQIGAGLLDGIDVVGLEEIELGIRINDDGSVEAIGKVCEGGRTAVKVPVVAAEEEIDVCRNR